MDVTSPASTLPAPTPQRNHSIISLLPNHISNSCKSLKKKFEVACSFPFVQKKNVKEIPFRAENPHIFDEIFVEENRSLNSEVDSEDYDIIEKISLEGKCD